MFGIDSGELLVIALVALVVIGPKDLPRVMRTVGKWVGQARGMARHFRSGFDAMIRESEIEDMEKKWREDNERIMRMHPPTPPGESDWGKPEGEGTLNGKPAAPPPESDAPVMKPLPAPAPRRPVARRGAPPVPRRPAPSVPDHES